MKILVTADPEIPVPPTNYGGIERVIDSLIRELRDRNHEIGLISHSESTCHVDWKSSWTRPSSRGITNMLAHSLALEQALYSFRPEVIHSFSRIAYMWLHLVTKLPKVMSYQREPTKRTTSLATRLAGRSLAFTGCSEHIAKTGSLGGGLWHAVPNFVDLRNFSYKSKVEEEAPLVFLSRIEPIKGCHTAIAIAKESGRRLLIAGNRVESGSAVGYWDTEIQPHLGKDGIEYVGEVNDVQKNELLGQAAAMVVPIEWEEPFGIVFAEALACGTPVIACPRGSVPQIVEDGVHGFHVRDVDEGVVAVERLVGISREACRNRVEHRFTVEVVATQYEEVYKRVIESSR